MKDEIASIGVARERIAIIPNSAEIAPQPWSDPGGHTALYSGSLSSEKGLDTLLDAWKIVIAQIPDARRRPMPLRPPRRTRCRLGYLRSGQARGRCQMRFDC